MEVDARRSSIKRSDPVRKSRSRIARNFAFATEYVADHETNGSHVTSINLSDGPNDSLTSTVSTTPLTDLTINRAINGSEPEIPRAPPPTPAIVLSRAPPFPSSHILLKQKSMVEVINRNESVENTGDGNWPVSKLGGKIADGVTSGLRTYWQQNVMRDEQQRREANRTARPKSYGFPKWRSTDALSASLVASNPVEIPKDSRIPDQRIQKMKKTEVEAMETKDHIHRMVESQQPPRLHKGKSLESLTLMAQKQAPWYDREKIRSAVSRESIANISAARQRFENGFNHLPPQNQQPPPLPPKSDEVQLTQRNLAQDMNRFSPNSSQYTPSYVESYGGQYHPDYHGEQFGLTLDQQLLLLYFKQNPHVLDGVGVIVTDAARLAADEIPWRRVELRIVDDEITAYQPQMDSPSQRQGRYLKKGVQSRYKPTRLDQSPAPYEESRPDRLIVDEIRMAREREDELRRSRSELGLASLEDTFDLWRSGQQPSFTSPTPMRSATSFDQLHHHQQQGRQTIGSVNDLSSNTHNGHFVGRPTHLDQRRMVYNS